MQTDYYTKILLQRSKDININLSDTQISQIFCYIENLQKWNKTYNLTAITKTEDIIEYHIIDALQIVKYLDKFENILDVGTGAGIPGIILAIYNPNRKITLIDKSNKKVKFLKHVCHQLNLDPKLITSMHTKIQESKPIPNHANNFDAIISRAVTQIEPFFTLTKHLLISNKNLNFHPHIFLMKGTEETIEQELKKLNHNNININIHKLDDLTNGEKRHLIDLIIF